MLKVIGAGLSRTGTYSLSLALEILGFNGISYDRERLNDVLDGTNTNPDFRIYDDVDSVVDIPSAYFYRELAQAYPEAKVILTVRDTEAWWNSIKVHFNVVAPVPEESRIIHRLARKAGWISEASKYEIFRRRLRTLVYGSPVASEFLYKGKYVRHNDEVIAAIPAERLLVMNIAAGEGWEVLCPFLGVPIPAVPFPRANKTNYENPAPWTAK